MSEDPFIYVVVRSDLSGPQVAVQAAHAAIELYRLESPATLSHPHLALCSAKSEAQLSNLMARLESQGVRVVPFREPDLGDSLTAFAAGPISGAARLPFRRLRLLTAGDLAGGASPRAELQPA